LGKSERAPTSKSGQKWPITREKGGPITRPGEGSWPLARERDGPITTPSAIAALTACAANGGSGAYSESHGEDDPSDRRKYYFCVLGILLFITSLSGSHKCTIEVIAKVNST
jgi:hypothetical protein